MASFLKLLVLLAVLGGTAWGTLQAVEKRDREAEAAKAAGGPGGPAAPLPAQGITLQRENFSFPIRATGVISPNESVEITSEQQRRLIAIHVQDGDVVKAGQVLFELDDTDLKADLRGVEARLEYARTREERLRKAVASNVATSTDLDEAVSERQALEAEAEVLRVDIAKARITAPFDGMAGFRRASLGALVSPAMPLLTLQDRSTVKIDFKVPERYAQGVKPGLSFRFRPDGYSQWYEGTVSAFEASIDPESRSLVVRGTAANTDGSLIPGAFVSVETTLQSWSDAILIPTQAVMPSATGSSVFVAVDGKAQRRKVELGVRTEDRVQVLVGLEAGEVLLASNLLRLRPGSAVSLLPYMAP